VLHEQPGTVANIVILPYKEEVAGSIWHRPLRKSEVLQVNLIEERKSRALFLAL
jgi:hypothetical protein